MKTTVPVESPNTTARPSGVINNDDMEGPPEFRKRRRRSPPGTDHTSILPSEEPETTYLLSGVATRFCMYPPGTDTRAVDLYESRDHKNMPWLLSADASQLPFGDVARALTRPVCPARVAYGLPSGRDQISRSLFGPCGWLID